MWHSAHPGAKATAAASSRHSRSEAIKTSLEMLRLLLERASLRQHAQPQPGAIEASKGRATGPHLLKCALLVDVHDNGSNVAGSKLQSTQVQRSPPLFFEGQTEKDVATSSDCLPSIHE